jgi:hypothetical protein
VESGDHRLCISAQSRIQSVVNSSRAAISFTAEAGKAYYFRTKTPARENSNAGIKLEPVDPAEAQVLIAGTALSASHLKK